MKLVAVLLIHTILLAACQTPRERFELPRDGNPTSNAVEVSVYLSSQLDSSLCALTDTYALEAAELGRHIEDQILTVLRGKGYAPAITDRMLAKDWYWADTFENWFNGVPMPPQYVSGEPPPDFMKKFTQLVATTKPRMLVLFRSGYTRSTGDVSRFSDKTVTSWYAQPVPALPRACWADLSGSLFRLRSFGILVLDPNGHLLWRQTILPTPGIRQLSKKETGSSGQFRFLSNEEWATLIVSSFADALPQYKTGSE